MNFVGLAQFPQFAGFNTPRTTLCTIDLLTVGPGVIAAGISNSVAWLGANLAVYCPVVTDVSVRVVKLFVGNGATVSGNIDVGLYTADGTRLASSGSTAQSGASVNQAFDITDLTIGPGLYYLAAAMDNTTGTLSAQTSADVVIRRMGGMLQQASAFPLPANATFAQCAQTSLPIIAATLQTVT